MTRDSTYCQPSKHLSRQAAPSPCAIPHQTSPDILSKADWPLSRLLELVQNVLLVPFLTILFHLMHLQLLPNSHLILLGS